jgi:hypothetical protein
MPRKKQTDPLLAMLDDAIAELNGEPENQKGPPKKAPRSLSRGSGEHDSKLFRYQTACDFMWMSVTLRVLQFEVTGGPSESDWHWLRNEAAAYIFGNEAHQVDRSQALCGGPGPKGAIAEGFNAVARVLSIFAFLPGGVQFGPHHFEGTIRKQ